MSSLINTSSCRICLKTGCFISIFNKINNKLICETISYVTGIKIERGKSKYPNKICDYCLQNICMAENIKNITLESEKYLNSILEESSSIPKSKSTAITNNQVKNEETEQPDVIIEFEIEKEDTIKKDLDNIEINEEIMDVFESAVEHDDFDATPNAVIKTQTKDENSLDLDEFDIIEEEPTTAKLPMNYKVERVFPCGKNSGSTSLQSFKSPFFTYSILWEGV